MVSSLSFKRSFPLSMPMQLFWIFYIWLNSGLIPTAIFLDVRQGFESFAHQIPSFKRSHSDIRGTVCTLFGSYLYGRGISVDPVFCSLSEILFWGPQGSVLWPALILIHVNHLVVAIVNQISTVLCLLWYHPKIFNINSSRPPSMPWDLLVTFTNDITISTARVQDKYKQVNLFVRVILGVIVHSDISNFSSTLLNPCSRFFL